MRLGTALLVCSVLPLAACNRASPTATASGPPAIRSVEGNSAELDRLLTAMHHHASQTKGGTMAKGKPIKVSTVIIPKAVEHGPHHH